MKEKRSEAPFLFKKPTKTTGFTSCKSPAALEMKLACYKEGKL